MLLNFSASSDKKEIFHFLETYLTHHHFTIAEKDDIRPWGGFFVLAETDAPAFIHHFFSSYKIEDLKIAGKLSPKILIVQPGKRLSWQYHHRRAEIWKLVGGEAKVVTSPTDEERDEKTLEVGDIITLQQGQRHRLIGATGQWGIVAEIWQHTDARHPSDEEDIVRLQDDFGR
jgi:mannose-6-phosphate isomerase